MDQVPCRFDGRHSFPLDAARPEVTCIALIVNNHRYCFVGMFEVEVRWKTVFVRRYQIPFLSNSGGVNFVIDGKEYEAIALSLSRTGQVVSSWLVPATASSPFPEVHAEDAASPSMPEGRGWSWYMANDPQRYLPQEMAV